MMFEAQGLDFVILFIQLGVLHTVVGLFTSGTLSLYEKRFKRLETFASYCLSLGPALILAGGLAYIYEYHSLAIQITIRKL